VDDGCEGVGGRAGEERRRGGRRRRRRGREPRRWRRAPWCWRKRIEEAELVEEKVELPTRMRRQVRTRGGLSTIGSGLPATRSDLRRSVVSPRRRRIRRGARTATTSRGSTTSSPDLPLAHRIRHPLAGSMPPGRRDLVGGVGVATSAPPGHQSRMRAAVASEGRALCAAAHFGEREGED